MGEHEGAPEGHKNTRPLTRVEEGRLSRQRRKQRRRRLMSTIGTGVVIAVLAAGLTAVLAHAVNSIERILPLSSKGALPLHGKKAREHRTRAANGNANAQGNARICLPRLVSEYPLDSWEVRAWTFPATVTPGPGQIAQINEADDNPKTVNQDLFGDGGYAPFIDTQFVLHNGCSQRVTITDIQVQKSCQPPLDGTIFVGQANLSEPDLTDTSTQLGFDLDSPDPEAMVTAGWDVGKWTQEYATGPLIAIPGNSDYAIDIRAIALHVACRFSILIRVLFGGKTLTEAFADDGQPFRVSALLAGVLKPGRPGYRPFAGYRRLYVGWAASPWNDGTWTRENPDTWQLVAVLL